MDTVLSWQNTALVMGWGSESGAVWGVRHQNVTKVRRRPSHEWYDGARRIVDSVAAELGLPQVGFAVA
jgi:hypothetical protein